jgi:glycosyltransferase involved in cell wall biosynthesis
MKEKGVAALARTKAALETDLLQTSLDLRRASEEYEALASAFRLSAERLREACGTISASHVAQEELRRETASLRTGMAELQRVVASLQAGLEALQAELEATRRERDDARGKLEELYSTRLWRLGTLYWRLLGRLGLLPTKAPNEAEGEPARAPDVVREPAAAPIPEDPALVASPAPVMPLPVEMPGRTFGSRRDPAGSGLPDIVCFSIVEWEFLFQRPQQLLSRLADLGHRVYYVSQFFDPAPGAPELHRLRSRIYALRLRGSARHPFSEELTTADIDPVFASLAALGEREGITSAVSLVHQPFWWPLAERARRAFGWGVLYDCMDDHAGFQTNARPVEGVERGILESADIVVATSRLLERRLLSANRPVEFIPNGCDVEYFSSISPRSRKGRPIVGYYGCIADWFDADLVADVAERRPEWDFVLIGPTYLADLTRLPSLPNVAFPGLVPYGQLLGRIEPFDVFILPFRRSPLTEAANPVKAYEIMATGRPLVSVPLPELEPFGDLVRFGSDPIEFGLQIDEALREDDPAVVDRRRDFARRNSWDARAALLERLVSSLGARKAPDPERPVDSA